MKGNLYALINPTWLADAKPKQIKTSLALKQHITNCIHEGKFDSLTNVQFMENVSEAANLLRDDRLELYAVFRKWKKNVPEKHIGGCTHIIHGDCYVLETVSGDQLRIQDLQGNQHVVNARHTDY